MQIKLCVKVRSEQIDEALKGIQIPGNARQAFGYNLNELGVHVMFDQKTGKIEGCELDNTYPKISPDLTEILHQIILFKEIWGTLSAARAKTEILIKEIEAEMYQKVKEGTRWRRDQCIAWLAFQDAIDVLHKLRKKHGV